MKLELPRDKNVLFFSPHPDDEVIGAGALLIRLVEQGNTIKMVYLTSGSDKEMVDQREREAEKVCAALGASHLFLRLDRSKGTEEGIRKLMGIIRENHPEIVLIPWEEDPHPTHRFSNELARESLNRTLHTGAILYYSIWTPLGRPDFFFSFGTGLMKKKQELMRMYSSQLERNAFDDAIEGLDRYHGVIYPELSSDWQDRGRVGEGYAEAFLVQERMKGKKVLALGDIFLDILPEPVERGFAEGSTSTQITFSPGGNAANFALALARLGCCSALYALTGRDWRSDVLEKALREGGVRGFLGKRGENTALTFALSFRDGKRHFFSDFGANLSFCANDLPELSPEFVHLHRAGFFWLPRLMGGPNMRILESAKKLGMTTSLDVGTPLSGKGGKGEWTDESRREVSSLLPFSDIFFGNREEVLGVAGERDLVESARSLIEKGAKLVVVHLGEDGASLYTEGEYLTIPAAKVTPLNPTGAGDVFNAAFVHCFIRGLPLKDCLEFAVAAGALHVADREDPYPSQEQVMEFMKRGAGGNAGSGEKIDNRGRKGRPGALDRGSGSLEKIDNGGRKES